MTKAEMILWYGFMSWNCFLDIKKKEISITSCVLLGFVKTIGFLLEGQAEVQMLFVRSLPGIFFLAASILSKNAVGAGDGWIVLVSGWYLGVSVTMQSVGLGMFFLSLLGILLLMMRKIRKNTEIPFVPFFFLGNLVVLL